MLPMTFPRLLLLNLPRIHMATGAGVKIWFPIMVFLATTPLTCRLSGIIPPYKQSCMCTGVEAWPPCRPDFSLLRDSPSGSILAQPDRSLSLPTSGRYVGSRNTRTDIPILIRIAVHVWYLHPLTKTKTMTQRWLHYSEFMHICWFYYNGRPSFRYTGCLFTRPYLLDTPYYIRHSRYDRNCRGAGYFHRCLLHGQA
jgi:hypothetical protein